MLYNIKLFFNNNDNNNTKYKNAYKKALICSLLIAK